jgi:Arc/MetJ-type ribon-helix-helix transcriptional regulator
MTRTPETGVARTVPVTTRMTPREKDAVDRQAALRGHGSTSDYIRTLVREDGRKIRANDANA